MLTKLVYLRVVGLLPVSAAAPQLLELVFVRTEKSLDLTVLFSLDNIQ